MLLDFKTFHDKVLGCWTGKNIGGVLGAPFECSRDVYDVTFYTQDLSKGPPPNDDLDLQIVWLAAVERYGRNVSSSILGEYWLSFVIPHWVEYGMGKTNLRAGLRPPLSGVVDNNFKDSCGCFIRSEIWACLAPGHPEIAARYAYEDATVDHADEGMYGEIFFAAMQSAAFAVSDKDALVEIGLSYIPEGCAVTRCVREAQNCYREKAPFTEMRKRIHSAAPGCFGVISKKISQIDESDLERGRPGFDAPENIGFTIAAWYYGEDDFGKSLCLAVNCGEDTDCTAATLGALLGIISGASALPEKWTAPLGDIIETMCIDKTAWGAIWIPKTTKELTDRVLRVAPSFLGLDLCDLFAPGGYTVDMLPGDMMTCPREDEYLPLTAGSDIDKKIPIYRLISSPYIIRQEYPAFRVEIDYHDGPFFKTGIPKNLTVTVSDNGYTKQQQWVTIRLWLPDGVSASGGKEFSLPMNYNYGSKAEASFEFTDTEHFTSGKIELIVDISLNARHSAAPVKIVLMRSA